jgi:hypothetical protein
MKSKDIMPVRSDMSPPEVIFYEFGLGDVERFLENT